MKPPSKNVSASLRGQTTGGRAGEAPQVSGMKPGPTMTVPGDGKVEMAPGTPKEASRSAANFCEPQSRFGGK